MSRDLEPALLIAIDALEVVGIRHALVGGLAVSAWVRPRATRDIDLYEELAPAVRLALEKELVSRGFHVPAMEKELGRFGVFRAPPRLVCSSISSTPRDPCARRRPGSVAPCGTGKRLTAAAGPVLCYAADGERWRML